MKNPKILMFWLILSASICCFEITVSIMLLVFIPHLTIEQYWPLLTFKINIPLMSGLTLYLLAIWIMTKKFRDMIMADVHHS